MPRTTLRPRRPVDLRLTLGPLRRGPADPTMSLSARRVARATRTVAGPATVVIEESGGQIRAEAWGPGAHRLIAALPALLGLDDAAPRLPAAHPLVTLLERRFAGLRIGRTNSVLEALVPAILEQKVTGTEAFRAWRNLVGVHGEPAPGPLGLRLAPDPALLAALPYHAFHPLGVEARRADTIRRAAAHASRLEEIVALPLVDAYRRLTAIAGVGRWTAAEVAARALGDADAISVGDFHLKHLVAWALAGEPRGSDERMLELLEPYRGQRGRVVRLLEASGIAAPRYGPRMAPRTIAGI